MLDASLGTILAVFTGGLLVLAGVVLGLAASGFKAEASKKKEDNIDPDWSPEFKQSLNK